MATFLDKLSVLILVVFLCSISFSACQEDEEDEDKHHAAGCNGTATELKTAEGKLEIAGESLKKTGKCSWNIAFASKVTRVPLYFDIRNLNLKPSDRFRVIDTKTKQLYDSTDNTTVATIVFTGFEVKGDFTIELELGENSTDRVFDVVYSYQKDHQLPISEDGTLSIVAASSSKSLKQDLNLHVQLQPALKSQFIPVVGFELVNAKTNIKCEIDKQTKDCVKADVILTTGLLTVEFSDWDLASNGSGVRLFYSLYKLGCTGYLQGNLSWNINIPEVNVHRFSSFQCLWILTGTNKGFAFDYSNFNFLNNLDVLTVRAGSQRNSPAVAVVDNSNKGQLGDSYLSTIVSGTTAYVVYQCPSTIGNSSKTSALKINQLASGGVNHGAGKLDIKAKESIPYIFEAVSDHAYVQIKASKLGKGVVSVYDTAEMSDVMPILVLDTTKPLPDEIVSRTTVLQLRLNGLETDLSVSYGSKKDVSTIIGRTDTDSFVLNAKDIECNGSQNYLIPSSPKDSVTELKISVAVLRSSASSIAVKQVGEKSDLTKLVRGSGLLSSSEHMPTLRLNAGSLYQLTYTRGEPNCTKGDNSIHFQASYSRKSYSSIGAKLVLKPSSSVTITPESYPGLFPLSANDVCTGSNECAWTINTTEAHVYAKFDDIDLAYGQVLSVKYDGEDIKPDAPLPDDSIIDNRAALQLKAPINSSYTIGSRMSGRGFKVQLESFDCGSLVTKNNSLETPSYPKPFTGSKCIWIVDKHDPKKYQSLNFTVDYGKGGNNGQLVIYDSATLRDPRTVDVSNSSSKSRSSVAKVIITYLPASKQPTNGIKISWVLNECNSVCEKSMRCILPEWLCNGKPDCGLDDWTDEVRCNGTAPPPTPNPPHPDQKSTGVSGWVIIFVIIPLAMFVGALVSKFGPDVIRRVRGGSYQEFRDFNDVN